MIESYPKGFAGFKRFTEEMDKQPSIKDLRAVAVSHLEGTIAYKDVSFAYEDGTKVLDHINLKIQPVKPLLSLDKVVQENDLVQSVASFL